METLRGYWRRALYSARGRQVYVWGALAVLLLSTLGWALASARVQQGNADQLVDGFLFEDGRTFHQALFPATHTLLFKWPLFWSLRWFHFSLGAYSALTAFTALATVGAFAYLLYRIERRPLVFGTVCLALASVLALVPAQVLGGVTAPLNMAMLTGRNLEYVVYVGALVLQARTKRFRGWQWV